MYRTALVVAFLIVFCSTVVYAQNIENLKFIVYDDGWVTVNLTLNTENMEVLNVPILGKPETITVTDENYEPLEYELEKGLKNYRLIIYTFGAGKVNVTYSTQSLTSKEGEIWQVSLASNTTFTIFMPKNSFILEIKEIPLSIEEKKNFIVLTMPPGNHTISYTIIYEEENEQGAQYILLLELSFFAVLVVVVLLYFAIKKYRAKKLVERISDIDKDIIEVLRRKGGKAYQHEIARELEIPKTTLWRHIIRLSEEGIIEIKKEGKYNLLILRI